MPALEIVMTVTQDTPMKRQHLQPSPGSAAKSEPLAIHTTAPFRVTYANTDRMGHAYYANYLTWFEMGRVELLRFLGQNYRDWEDQSDVFLPVKRCAVEYLRPAAFDDQIQVETVMTRLTRASVYFHYRVLRGDDVLAIGSSEHPFVNKEGRIVRVADKLLPQFFS